MSPTDWAAWLGVSTGLGSLGWQVYTKLTAGPRLRVTAFAGMVKMPPPQGNPKFLSVTVNNNGTAMTTLTNLAFGTYDSWWATKRRRAARMFVVAEYEGPKLPQKLEVGGEWRALMKHDEEFDELLNSKTLWLMVNHSFSRQPICAKIPPSGSAMNSYRCGLQPKSKHRQTPSHRCK